LNQSRFYRPAQITAYIGVLLAGMLAVSACHSQKQEKAETQKMLTNMPNKPMHYAQGKGKPVIYQVFTRLFGNTNTTNKAWGSLEENGVGKFSDFTDTALLGIKELGTSYIWYTGVPHHALVGDYSQYGISIDDPDVIKGRAGSPYAVKDYYNVNPDLATHPENRLAEFEALIKRTHKHNMKVIIDIVPNHVARKYESVTLPEGQNSFGTNDDKSLEYAKHNNFYYIPGKSFDVPEGINALPAAGGNKDPLADGQFYESPAKWTGNGSRAAKPRADDWYETVKVNYGVKPDGSYDFPKLPNGYRNLPHSDHYTFWQQQQDLPDSWYKFEAIVHYWLEKGVDGFRYDMAEMVPVEFWSFLNSSIKAKFPDTLLLAEVYQPNLYRDYVHIGKMDYLYDKVEFYDTLKLVMQNKGPSSSLEEIQTGMADIEKHMLHFLENHDEQRIASPDFAGNADKGKPALVVSALISSSPTMLYFAQDVGEDGSEKTGFGAPTRTTIFDYSGVPAHQRWMNDGAFDGAKLSESEQQLRDYYITIMRISAEHNTMLGDYQSIHSYNLQQGTEYSEKQFSFVRYNAKKALIVISNFSDFPVKMNLSLPSDLISKWQLNNSNYSLTDLVTLENNTMKVGQQNASVAISLDANESSILELKLNRAVQ
jgi:glycosidase